MNHYHAPRIERERTLEGRLQTKSQAISDATVKHGVENVDSPQYRTPEITAERQLDAKLIPISELDNGRN